MRLEPREQRSPAILILYPMLALLASVIVCAALVMLSGASPLSVFGLMVKGAAGTTFAFLETLTRATPLIFTGLAAAVAFRAKLWNIGGEAQLYIGAVMTVVLGTGFLPLPQPILIPVLMVAAMLGGAMVLSIPTFLKTRFGVDEVVTTLLLNFIAILFVSMLLEGILKDPTGLGWPQSKKVIAEAQLPKLIQGKRLHFGFVIAIAAAIAVWIIDRKSTLGYEMRAVGHSPKAASFAGIPVNRVLAKTALLSGGLAGLAGMSEVTGLK
ncbi:MAG: ABC transporter permease, partial [Aestuariivirga sp.]|nr:ABC transporter permease [Aestuariivirga sp.]